MPPKKILNPSTGRMVARTGRVGRAVASARLDNLPQNVVRRIATVGGPEVGMRLALTSRSTRGTVGPNISARVASARDAFLKKLRMARRAFAKVQGAYTMAGRSRRPNPRGRGMHVLPDNGGRVGRTNFPRQYGGVASFFKVGGERFEMRVQNTAWDTYAIGLWHVVKYTRNNWRSVKVVDMAYGFSKFTLTKKQSALGPRVTWNPEGRLNPVLHSALRQAIDTYRSEMRVATSTPVFPQPPLFAPASPNYNYHYNR